VGPRSGLFAYVISPALLFDFALIGPPFLLIYSFASAHRYSAGLDSSGLHTAHTLGDEEKCVYEGCPGGPPRSLPARGLGPLLSLGHDPKAVSQRGFGAR